MNLFIAHTTLHLVIVKKIIQFTQVEQPHLLFIGNRNIKRNEYYLNELKKDIKQFYFFNNLFEQEWSTKKSALKEIRKKITDEFDYIFLSQYSDKFHHMLLSYIKFDNVCTYDDGIVNFNPLTHYTSKPSQPNIMKRIINKFINGRKYFAIDLIQNSKLHYTLFNQSHPLFSKVKYLPLLNVEKAQIMFKSKKVSILVGAYYKNIIQNDEHSFSVFKSKVNHLIEQLGISLYLPHPLDEYNYFNCEMLLSEKISEEVIYDYLLDGYDVSVYGFGSSIQYHSIFDGLISNCILYTELMTEATFYICNNVFDRSYDKINLDRI